MKAAMALVAKGNGLTAVVLVHGDGVLENRFPLAVKFPQPEDDMVQFNDVVDFQPVIQTTADAISCPIAFGPTSVLERGTDAMLNAPYLGIPLHLSII
jgi:hypothetical protein